MAIDDTPTKKKADRTIPDLSNATSSFLIDEIGRMRAEAARLKFLDGVYKQALEARITEKQAAGSEFIRGEFFIGDYKEMTTERIDSDAVRQHFADDPEGLRKVMRVITFKQLSTKVKPE